MIAVLLQFTDDKRCGIQHGKSFEYLLRQFRNVLRKISEINGYFKINIFHIVTDFEEDNDTLTR